MKRVMIIALICLVSIEFASAQKIWNILKGDHADPGIVRVGNDYYMTFSSFNYVPGLEIWHSTNLKHWELTGHALTEYVGRVWSPDFVYHQNKYYIYFSARGSNFVVVSDSPEGPWTSPIDLKTNGIDPGHIVTPDGERYLYFNNGWMVRLSEDGLSVKGEKTKVYEGWPVPNEWNIECFCLEAPKLFHKDGYYYILNAQGGTAGPSTSHMVVSARSENVTGPWENSAFNPVLRTWSPKETWWSKGHATLIDDPKGNWFLVYHAYKQNEINRGRQVLVEPVKWTKDKWFRLKRNPTKEPPTLFVDNLKLEDDAFETIDIKDQWMFSGIKNLAEVVVVNGQLQLRSERDNVKALLVNTPDTYFDATIKLEPESKNDSMEYGFVLYYDESNYTGIALKGKKMYALDRGEKGKGPLLDREDFKYFRINRRFNDLQMGFSEDGKNWYYYPTGREVSGYQHNMLRGFKSLKLGVISKGNGILNIDDFQYLSREIEE